ncbi:MAG: YihY/virulence factor BrkB family protein [Actinobacteria bacterium]|nr:YihY/virulence factor BrkB family protein [Actinomycetota bacterium]
MFKKIFNHLNEFISKCINDSLTILAASISYYTLFSIFPILLVVLSISGIFLTRLGWQDIVYDFIAENIPAISDFVLKNVEGIIKNIVSIGVIGIIIFIYGASSVFTAIENALIKIFAFDRKKIIISKLYGFLIIILINIIGFIAIGVSVLFSFLTQNAINFFAMSSGTSSVLFKIISLLGSFTFNFLLFLSIYYFGLGMKLNFRHIWIGAIAGAIAWEGAKTGFVFYLNNFSNYAKIYGSIGSIIVFLFWVYISALILLLGAELIYFKMKRTSSRRAIESN